MGRGAGRLVLLTACAVMVASCSAADNAGGSAAGSTQGLAESPSASASPTASDPATGATAEPPPMGIEQAADEFLAVTCPTDTALHVLGNVGVAAGGWGKVKPRDSKPYAQSAIEQARTTAERLLDTKSWPAEVAASIPQVADEYLAIVTPLQLIASATSGSQMTQPWVTISSKARTAEQRVRLELGLGTAGSEEDGCPPAPKVVAPKAPSSSSGSGSASSSAWVYRWESPSGNLRCGYAPRSSRGVPVVACLDSDTNTLARLYRGYSAAISSATSSQRRQLPGGVVKDFYQGIQVGPFGCALLDQGMTCRDGTTGAGFVIRRGVAYPT